MKFYYKSKILFVLFFFTSTFCYCQNVKDTTKTPDSLLINQAVSSKFDEIINLIKNNASGSKQPIGVISYSNTSPIYIYLGNPLKKTGRTINIDSVSLELKDGYILNIQVFSGQKKFINTRAPISLKDERLMKIDFLISVKNVNEGIVMKDILNFNSFRPFIPEDDLIWLTPNHKSEILYKNSGVNNVFDLRVYSDALGLFGKSSNGIIQTDARYKYFIHRKNVPQTGAFFGQYIKINFTASKFEAKENLEDSVNFSRSRLMQKATFHIEGAYNIWNSWIERKAFSFAFWDIGVGVSASHLARKQDTLFVFTDDFFSEIGLNLKSNSNFGADINFRAILQYSPQTKFDNDGKPVWFFRAGAELYWNPLENAASRIFGRYNYTFSTKNEDKVNHFSQLQFGYSVLLNKLVSKGK